ncbi:hypothetical protein [Ornithinibacillus halotolerans]|uniref:Uncharacterized protein n=1 Tax=Ornithinibacillus halotolerans TaxID=1274357 RepID=A0A916S2L0_9BACI|nr:hypothetical protein [Ornithinibacillus halotolerans]GGA79950.1 hypothetical protein GCM10008025_24190 [Ornithinibacillus halotolerans]
MPERDTGTETTPHPDGKKESIINDSKGKQIGMSLSVDRAEFTSLTQMNDEQLKRFEKLMRGKPNSDEQ